MTSKSIRAYIYSGYATLKKPSVLSSCQSFYKLEDGLAFYADQKTKGRFTNIQIVFIDFSVTPSRIIHILEP